MNLHTLWIYTHSINLHALHYLILEVYTLIILIQKKIKFLVNTKKACLVKSQNNKSGNVGAHRW